MLCLSVPGGLFLEEGVVGEPVDPIEGVAVEEELPEGQACVFGGWPTRQGRGGSRARWRTC